MNYKRQIDLGFVVFSITFGVMLATLRLWCGSASVPQPLLPM